MRKEVGKMDYKFLLDIAIILASTKILGLFTKKVNMPQVVGALLAGVILGPACVGVLTETDMIQNIAELCSAQVWKLTLKNLNEVEKLHL